MESCYKEQKKILTTIITNINQTTGNPPTFDIIRDEIGLVEGNECEYTNPAYYKFNFNFQKISNLIPIFERGGMEAGLFHKCSFQFDNAVVLQVQDNVGDPSDGNLSSGTLIVYHDTEYVAP